MDFLEVHDKEAKTVRIWIVGEGGLEEAMAGLDIPKSEVDLKVDDFDDDGWATIGKYIFKYYIIDEGETGFLAHEFYLR